MSDLITERRSSSKPSNLKRSKSVRSSLRLIGTKLLLAGGNHKMHRTPSLSSLRGTTTTANQQTSTTVAATEPILVYDEAEEDMEQPLLNLRTPMVRPTVEVSSRGASTVTGKGAPRAQQLGQRWGVSTKTAVQVVRLTQTPAVVAPKAAALLQIPIKENWEPVRYEEYAEVGRAAEEFRRGAMRLSLAGEMRRKGMSTAFSSTSKLPTLSSECDSMEVATQFAAPLRRPTTGGGHPPSSMMPPAPPPPAPPSTGHSTSSKSSKKQVKLMQQRLERLARINIHLHALFAAVEHGHLEKARTILESTDVDVNSVNNDGLSPLDVAVLSNNRPLMKMLVGFGAKEGGQFSSPEKLGAHLKHLLGEAEMRLQELGGLLEEPCVTPLNTRASFSSMIGSAYPSSTITGCAGGDNDKQALAWGRRAKMMKRLVLGFAQARPPDPPSLVAVDITAQQSVSLRLQEPVSSDSPMTTKFKVQWSTRPDFSPITGELEITDLEKPNCIIDLTQGRRYFFRAASGNVKGYGIYVSSTPTSMVPSSWRDLEDKDIRFAGRQRELDDLTAEVRLLRPDSEMLEPSAYPPVPSVLQQQQQNQQQPPVQQQRRPTRKKTTIKQLFTAASRFQKHLRRGCHLACVLYHEDKVLVTNEDFLPVIEIDETYPSSLHTDVHWLMKVACTWDDTKSLRVDMDKHASSAIHFRTKLLAAAMQMQSALCLQDLGQLYHRALRDSQGTVVLSTINYVKNPKSVSVLNSRWLPLNKLFKKCLLGDDHSVAEMLMASIQDQINYHQVSALTLGKGLYLTYLKLQSSVDTIQVVVPAKSPNILPHCKIRDNPHVSAEEWEYLKHYTTFPPNAANEQQRTFLELITSAARRLFNYMDLPPEDALNHRLYDTEVIDLSGEVSCIIVCPAAEYSCSVPGQRELLLQRGDLLSLPVQVYEMIHIGTYHRHLMQRYAKLSCLLELDAATASHLHREAFSNAEVAVAKDRLNKLHDLQNRLGVIWRCMRWLMDAITFSRDRNSTGIPMRILLDRVDLPPTTSHPLTDYPITPPKHSLLQIPPSNKGSHMTPSGGSGSSKSTPGRGSWPGPSGATPAPHHHLHHGGGSGGGLLTTEFSKSEQHLYIASSTSQELGMNGGGEEEEEMERSDQVHQLDATSLSNNTSQYLSACCSSDGESPRKSSDASDYFNECCRQPDRIEGPLVEGVQPSVSRSEDMLYVIPPYHPCKHQQSQARIRSNTVSSVSATTSPLLNVRPLYTGSLLSVNTINTTNTSDSMHSLSSDSDNGFGCSTPLGSSTPHKAHKSKMLPSRSMTNVKHNVQLDSSTRSERYTTQRPRHLNVEPFVPSNLDTSLSKSLSNIKNLVESDHDQRTYLKPVAERTTLQDQDPTFKVPYSEPTPGTSISSGSSNVTPNPSCTTSVAPGGKSAPNGDSGNSGILQVYAAYDTGLATGTSLKLHVTPRTTAREVVDLVVKQLNMAVVLKGKDGPIYSPDRLRNFCLVAVIGARERCLRDDFKPLQLQNPWKKGRLYVRQKQDVLAALEHSSKHSAII